MGGFQMARKNVKKEVVEKAVAEFDISEEPIDENLETLKQILATQQQILVMLEKVYRCLPFTKRD
jgi:hypothetical protein